MTKQQYLKALRAALGRLPRPQVDDILVDYEEYFRDGLASGRSEEDVAAGLGDPVKIAREWRAEMRIQAWQSQRSFANLARAVIAIAALGSLNLFLAIPMIVMMALLTASYVASAGIIVFALAVAISFVPGVGGIFHDIHVAKFDQTAPAPDQDQPASPDKDALSIHIDTDQAQWVEISSIMGLGATGSKIVIAGGGLPLGILWFVANLWITRFLIAGFVKYARLNYSIIRGD